MKTDISSASTPGGRSGSRQPSARQRQSGWSINPLSSRSNSSSWFNCPDLSLPSAQLTTAPNAVE
eukprot:11188163-Lingulodinium_polyedra.AAC.1